MPPPTPPQSAAVRVQLVADIARSAFGHWAGYLMAALIVWTAFAIVFSLLLGYSRVPYAAARDGNYFRFLAAVHPKHAIPHRSLVALGLVAAVFCFFSLAQVITMLVITRILLQFFLQQVGVILLRIQRPDLPRPFRIPLYPAAAARRHRRLSFHARQSRTTRSAGLWLSAAGIAVSGTLIYLVRAPGGFGQWPFASPQQTNRLIHPALAVRILCNVHAPPLVSNRLQSAFPARGQPMLIGKPPDIPSSEITPQDDYDDT